MEGSQKIKNRTTKNQVDAEILLLDSYPKTDDNINLQIYIYMYIYFLCFKVLNEKKKS